MQVEAWYVVAVEITRKTVADLAAKLKGKKKTEPDASAGEGNGEANQGADEAVKLSHAKVSGDTGGCPKAGKGNDGEVPRRLRP